MFGSRSRIVPEAVDSIYVDTQILSATLESDLIDGLIGRDVLTHFHLSYDGKTGTVRMKYHKPVQSTAP